MSFVSHVNTRGERGRSVTNTVGVAGHGRSSFTEPGPGPGPGPGRGRSSVTVAGRGRSSVTVAGRGRSSTVAGRGRGVNHETGSRAAAVPNTLPRHAAAQRTSNPGRMHNIGEIERHRQAEKVRAESQTAGAVESTS